MKLFIAFWMFVSAQIVLAAHSADHKDLQKITLALNWKPEPEFGGFYEAQWKGFYKEQDLDVTILEGGSGTPTAQLLANGKVDFAIVSADEIILANSKNKNKIKAVFAVYQKSPTGIMTRADRGFKTLKDVFDNDGILALQKGLPYVDFLLKKYPKAKVQIVPYQGGIASFTKEAKFSQQGFSFSEPVLAEKAGVKPQFFYVADEGFNPYTTVVAVREETLKNNRELVVKMLKATKQGWQSYVKSPASTNQEMAKMNKAMSLEVFNLSTEAQNVLIGDPVHLGAMTKKRWEELQQQMLDLKLIKKKTEISNYFESL